jgi:hypothetical protein
MRRAVGIRQSGSEMNTILGDGYSFFINQEGCGHEMLPSSIRSDILAMFHHKILESQVRGSKKRSEIINEDQAVDIQKIGDRK